MKVGTKKSKSKSKAKAAFFDKDDFVIDKKKKKVHLKDRYFNMLPKGLTKEDVKKVFEYEDQYVANVVTSAKEYLTDGFDIFDTSINHGAGLRNEEFVFTRGKEGLVMEHASVNPSTSLTAAALKVLKAAK